MTFLREHIDVTNQVRLTVRAATGHLRVIPVWQALGERGIHAVAIRVRCHAKENLDELILTFDSASRDEWIEVTLRLNRHSWVVATSVAP